MSTATHDRLLALFRQGHSASSAPQCLKTDLLTNMVTDTHDRLVALFQQGHSASSDSYTRPFGGAVSTRSFSFISTAVSENWPSHWTWQQVLWSGSWWQTCAKFLRGGQTISIGVSWGVSWYGQCWRAVENLLAQYSSNILNILARGLLCQVLIGCCRRKLPTAARLIIAPWNCLYLQLVGGIHLLHTIFNSVYVFRLQSKHIVFWVAQAVTMNSNDHISEHTKRTVQSDDEDDEERTKKVDWSWKRVKLTRKITEMTHPLCPTTTTVSIFDLRNVA